MEGPEVEAEKHGLRHRLAALHVRVCATVFSFSRHSLSCARPLWLEPKVIYTTARTNFRFGQDLAAAGDRRCDTVLIYTWAMPLVRRIDIIVGA